MAAGSTYTPIATTTLGSATSSVTFNSFTGYTDLVLVFNGTAASGSGSGISIQFNGDTGSNYSETILAGSGTAAGSGRDTSLDFSVVGTIYTTSNNAIVQFMNYSNSTTYKTILSRSTPLGVWVSCSLTGTEPRSDQSRFPTSQPANPLIVSDGVAL